MEKEPMDKEQLDNFLPEDRWFEDLLAAPEVGTEIGADEQAMSSLGLPHLSDVELEKILQEAREEDWGIPESPVAPEPFRDAEYRDTFGEGYELQKTISEALELKNQPEEPLPYSEEAPPYSGEEPLPYSEEAPPYSGEDPEYGYYEEDPEQGFYEEDPNAPVRKVRPRRKKGYGLLGIPHLLSAAIWMVIVVAIGATLGRMIWICAAEVLAFGRENKTITVTITEHDDIDSIAQKLQTAGLIRYPELFKFYANLTDAQDKITAGTFELQTVYDYMALVDGMSPVYVTREEVEVVIPEGYTCAQIFELLESAGVCSAADLESWSQEGELEDYWFLEGVDRAGKYCLEGYLFPDTYRFYKNSTPKQALEKMLNGFNHRFDEDMKTYLDSMNVRFAAMMAANGYGADFIEEHKLTIREIIIIASMVEKESAGNAEGYAISSVIYNRLANPGAHPYLNIDATIVYALGGKTNLTPEDYLLDSPYNTYTNPGLPPGPISNPGLSSIYAALDPDESDYFYYALDPETNRHHFSTTKEEHDAFLDSIKEQS